MFVITHAALGALIGESMAGHPAVAFGLGMASHFLTDIIPHGDTHLYKNYIAGTKVNRAVAYVVIDSILTIFFVLFVFNSGLVTDKFAVTMGIVGGVLPDFLVALVELFKIRWLGWFHRLHFFFHNLVCARKGDMSFSSGFAMQIVFLVALFSKLF
jgi:hypothetical protein